MVDVPHREPVRRVGQADAHAAISPTTIVGVSYICAIVAGVDKCDAAVGRCCVCIGFLYDQRISAHGEEIVVKSQAEPIAVGNTAGVGLSEHAARRSGELGICRRRQGLP